MKDLYFQITDDGYVILDRNDELFRVRQYEPYIPDKSKTYEENAQAQIHKIMVSDYIYLVLNEEIVLEEVPEAYFEDVKAVLDRIHKDASDEATEQDYINALAELGVTDDEEVNA